MNNIYTSNTVIPRSDILPGNSFNPYHNTHALIFYQWTSDQFILFCCLTGCDYVRKVKSIGIRTAYTYVSKYNTMRSLMQALRIQYPNEVDDDYILDVSICTYVLLCWL